MLKIIEENNILTVVIGIPYSMDGEIREQGEKSLEYISLLKKKMPNLTIETWDERLSTVQAKKIIHSQGKKQRKKTVKKGADALIAAAIILQAYLDSQSHQN